jgi:lipid II:glycine glycyltransferase (peptidoglycan interpeptide bridge formation enzyme)
MARKIKFNGYEQHLLLKGLEFVKDDFYKDIEKAEKKKRHHIMTKGYVDIVLKELKDKIKKFS